MIKSSNENEYLVATTKGLLVAMLEHRSFYMQEYFLDSEYVACVAEINKDTVLVSVWKDFKLKLIDRISKQVVKEFLNPSGAKLIY